MNNESTFCGIPISALDMDEVQMALIGQGSREFWDKIDQKLSEKDKEPDIKRGAVKYDSGKAPLFKGLLSYFPNALSAVAEVSAFGASKYAWNGWRGVNDGFNRYSDALLRHLEAEAKGEDFDQESKKRHAAHTAWNALARLELLMTDGYPAS